MNYPLSLLPRFILATLFSCFLLALILAICGCGKEDKPTFINGKITNRKTGEPMEGVSIILQGKRTGTNGQVEYFTHGCPLTDTEGRFSCTLEGLYVTSDITKEGYIKREVPLSVVDRQENNLDITLVPRDGFLKLKIENNTGLHDTLYANIYSPTESLEKYYNGEVIKEYPLLLTAGASYTETFALASPETVQILWGFKPPGYQTPHTLKDSILVVPHDTTTYILSY